MFSLLIDYSYALESHLFCKTSFVPQKFIVIWDRFKVEWFLLQLAAIYTFIRLIGSKNYFKQLLQLLFLIVILALYVSLMQLELFACFMFIAEFTIVIFFYTLFLHLKVAVSQREASGVQVNAVNKFIIAFLVFIGIFVNPRAYYGSDMNLVFLDVYAKSLNFALNDINFFFYTITRNDVALHSLVGLLLLFLTIFLFMSVNVYYFLNISKQDVFVRTCNKLATARGYYEQVGESVQKILTNFTKK